MSAVATSSTRSATAWRRPTGSRTHSTAGTRTAPPSSAPPSRPRPAAGSGTRPPSRSGTPDRCEAALALALSRWAIPPNWRKGASSDIGEKHECASESPQQYARERQDRLGGGRGGGRGHGDGRGRLGPAG